MSTGLYAVHRQANKEDIMEQIITFTNPVIAFQIHHPWTLLLGPVVVGTVFLITRYRNR